MTSRTRTRQASPREQNALDLARLGLDADQITRLQYIARGLHSISERQCNEQMTEATEARLEARDARLTNEAKQIAASVNCEIYEQGDPRGWPLYLYRLDAPEVAEIVAKMAAGEADKWALYHYVGSRYSSIGTGVCCQ